MQNTSWQNWVSDGDTAGDPNLNNRVEGIQIRIVPKIKNKPIGIQYQTHLENISWQEAVNNGDISGKAGLRVEGIKIQLLNAPADAGIEYQGHAEGVSWQKKVTAGQLAGTEYIGKRLEGIRIKLINLEEYSIQYRAYITGQGWQDWVSDGELAGTEYIGRQMEQIQIKIVPKIYNSIIQIEQPTQNHVSQNKVTISGWALSEYAETQVRIFVDNIQMSANVTRTQRDDVVQSSIQESSTDVKVDYGGTTTNTRPGYTAELDISSVAKGTHTLYVKLYDKNGAFLTQAEKRVVFYGNTYMGIDVSTYQGRIDWQKVKNSGVQYAMIRIGYRGYRTGAFAEDAQYKRNIEEANRVGIKVGLYFFTQAVNEQEAIEEAQWVINKLNEYGHRNLVQYPIAIDTEESGADNKDGRADNLDKQTRTNVCKAFAERIKQEGYTPMIYANKYWLNRNLDMNVLDIYDVWLAHYVNGDPFANPSDYKGTYTMWQYTSNGSVNGINGNVDMNIGYRTY